MKARFRSILLLLVVFAACSGCKMSYSFTGADVPPEAQTFSVEYFQSTAPLANPSYSQRLTEELKSLFLNQTRLALVKNNGDLQFSGVIVGYDVAPNAIQGNETAAQTRLKIRVRFNYRNTFDEKKNIEREIERFADFPATRSFATEEARLIQEINTQLVQDIFNATLGNW